MKITDYEIARIEANVISFFEKSEIPFVVEPDVVVRSWNGPYIQEGGKPKYITNMMVVSKCTIYKPNTPSEEFQVLVIGPRELFNKMGRHTKLWEWLKPLVDSMDCWLEVNYAKHYRGYQRVYITIKHNV